MKVLKKTLEIDRVDLQDLGVALEDHTEEGSWWLDPRSGALEQRSELFSDDEGGEHPAERGLVRVEPISSRTSYGDLEDFTALVRDPRARELLERAIAGRGAFRRFKDTLFEFAELRAAWFKFHDTRMARRAIEWLRDEELVDDAAAELALTAHPDPALPETGRPPDSDAIGRQVAADLSRLYGRRLRQVVVFGSRARGDAHPESDLDLVVVLDEVADPWHELRHMDEVLWNHTLAGGIVISAIPVGESDFERPSLPALIRARREGRPVA